MRDKDLESEVSPFDLIHVKKEFLKVFPNESSGTSPELGFDFSIELLPEAQPISIPPYRMSPTELEEIKAQLKDFLDKDYIQESVSL